MADVGPLLSGFDPLVVEWFERRFTAPTEPQILGWPEIRAGRDVLISAPTGSGKTLAAFLICLDRAGARRARGHAAGRDRSGLRLAAQSAQQRHPQESRNAAGRDRRAGRRTAAFRSRPSAPPSAPATRPCWERQQMGKQPPHILVTTPESLFILLTAEGSRRDAAHHPHGDRRRNPRHGGRQARLAPGAVARASRRTWSKVRKPQRIGLSATVKPIEEVAHFLSPGARIVNVGHRRAMDLAVEVPKDELGAVATNEMWAEIYDRLAELIRANRTTLVFVNTRRLSERVSHALGRAAGRERRAAASRQPLARAAPRRGSAAEERRAARRGGHRVARARHRHRHRRSGLPDRLAALDRRRAAAHRPLRPLGRRASRRAASSPPRATS